MAPESRLSARADMPPDGNRAFTSGRLGRVVLRLEGVSDWQLFTLAVIWVIAGGLLFQLVLLPHVIHWAHSGHGLIMELDSVGYDALAADQARRISEQGWRAWELRPMGHVTPGVASIFYLVQPAPWIMLPFNGVLFAAALVVVRRMLTVITGSTGIAGAALLPFFAFPSFVPIWGQLQKDVVTGAGVALVLYGVILVARRDTMTLGRPIIWAVSGLALVWLARPYSLVIVAGATIVAAAIVTFGRGSRRRPVAALAGVVVVTAVVGIEPWQLRGALPATTVAEAQPGDRSTDMAASPAASERARQALARIDAACAPYPSAGLVDRMLFSLCTVRANFIGYAESVNATSGFDYDVRVRTFEDFVGYLPRAIVHTLFAPGPEWWGSERTPIGRLATIFVPFEMGAAYFAFALWGVAAWRRRVGHEVWAIAAFCLFYSLCFAYATPQLGTLYRMRAFPFSILVSTALAVWLVSRPTAGADR